LATINETTFIGGTSLATITGTGATIIAVTGTNDSASNRNSDEMIPYYSICKY